MMTFLTTHHLLPLIFAGLLGFSILVYVILDGYDLGIGILMGGAKDEEKDKMLATVSPFWDANETWLVLAVGILLVGFPEANGMILGELYIPTAIMLTGLILRGVSFDFRSKVKDEHKKRWNRLFFAGSLITSLTQGYMLGSYIMGLQHSISVFLFACVTALCLVCGYCLIGACWLILKSEGELQQKAIGWAKYALVGSTGGIMLVSIATPFISERIFKRWFHLPEMLLLFPIPAITGALILFLWFLLNKMPRPNDNYAWLPFATTVGIFCLCFQGLAYSFYPYILPDSLTIWKAASDNAALGIILAGVVVVLPCIIGYNIFAYRIFKGKISSTSYY